MQVLSECYSLNGRAFEEERAHTCERQTCMLPAFVDLHAHRVCVCGGGGGLFTSLSLPALCSDDEKTRQVSVLVIAVLVIMDS